MVITYHGGQFFKIQQGDILVVFNPPHNVNRFGATVGISSLNHPDFNGIHNLSHGDKEAFIVSGPGEYEIKEIFIQGFGASVTYKKEQKINTAYYLTVEGVRICFLGVLEKPVLPQELEESIGEVDLLFVPIGGGEVLTPSDAHKMTRMLEAKITIPMHYNGDKSPELKKFLDESSDDVKPIDRLTVRKKDFEGKEGEVIVLKQV